MDENKRPPTADQITMPGFEPPTQEETIIAIWRGLQEQYEREQQAEEQADIEAHRGADPAPLLQDMNTKLYEIQIMGERCSRPEAIAIVAESARRDALRLEAATGMEAFFAFAETLKEFAGQLKAEGAQEVQDAETRSVVFTPDTTDPKTGERIPGREFILPDELAEYKKASPFAAKVWEEQNPQPTQAEIIKSNIGRVSFALDALKSPEDALSSYDNIPPGYLRRYTAAHFARLVQEVAKQTGADPAQIADKDRRTPEQQRLLLEAGAREQIARLDAFMNCNYMQAMRTLDPLHGVFREGAAAAEGTALGVKEYAVLYFFAEHEDIKATGAAELTPEQLTELTEIYNRLDAFYAAHQDPGTDPTPETLYAFIEQEYPDPAAAEGIIEKLPLLRAIIPTKHTIPNNAVMTELRNPEKAPINAGEHDTPVMGEKGKRKEVTAIVKIDYDENRTGIKLTTQNMTEYEQQVSDAIITLWLYGDESHIMTSDMIYRTMTGQGSEGKAPAGQKGAITKFMQKWEGVRVYIDCTEEMRKRGITDKSGKPIREFIFDEYYINTRRVRVRAGNETVTAWQILSKPVMLTYSEMTKQLLTMSASLLDIKEVTVKGQITDISLNNSTDRIAVKGNMLRRIHIMKGKNRNKAQWSSIIAFDKLFEETGVDNADRIKRSKMIAYCRQCLDYWKAKGYIIGYTVRRSGKKITGVDIIL